MGMKESPVFLLVKQKEALTALQFYRESSHHDRSNTEKELMEMELTVAGPQLSLPKMVAKLIEWDNLKPFTILMGIFTIYPLTGMYSITYFAIDLFNKLGLGNVQIVAISVAMARALGTMLSSGLMQRMGRRKLFIPSTAAGSLCVGLVGAIMIIRDYGLDLNDTIVSWILIILLFTFMFLVGISFCGIPWVLMAEWFPADVKPLITGTLILWQFLFIFLAVQLTTVLISLLSPGGLFLYFSCVCALYCVYVTMMVPETHGRLYGGDIRNNNNI